MKRTCNNCKALIRISGILQCEFRYKVKCTGLKGMNTGAIPLEECPKPKTWTEYYRQVKLLSGGK